MKLFKVVIVWCWDKDENPPFLFSAAKNTDKMAAAMLSATLSLSVCLSASAGATIKLPLIPSQAICADN